MVNQSSSYYQHTNGQTKIQFTQSCPFQWYIPTDAGIISGYSGGPAFNMNGELIGISNAAYTGDLSAYGSEHLGLIIPINRVKEQIEAALH